MEKWLIALICVLCIIVIICIVITVIFTLKKPDTKPYTKPEPQIVVDTKPEPQIIVYSPNYMCRIGYLDQESAVIIKMDIETIKKIGNIFNIADECYNDDKDTATCRNNKISFDPSKQMQIGINIGTDKYLDGNMIYDIKNIIYSKYGNDAIVQIEGGYSQETGVNSLSFFLNILNAKFINSVKFNKIEQNSHSFYFLMGTQENIDSMKKMC